MLQMQTTNIKSHPTKPKSEPSAPSKPKNEIHTPPVTQNGKQGCVYSKLQPSQPQFF